MAKNAAGLAKAFEGGFGEQADDLVAELEAAMLSCLPGARPQHAWGLRSPRKTMEHALFETQVGLKIHELSLVFNGFRVFLQMLGLRWPTSSGRWPS